MNRTQIINLLIKKFDYKTYLEIGCFRNRNFNEIHIEKTGVDPARGGNVRMTSDEFFKQNNKTFDIIFIDGLHHCDQVYKDMVNSINVLNTNGTIVVHDCIPESYKMQVVPRLPNIKAWNGDVWKGWLKLRSERENLQMFVVNVDQGCGVIRNGTQTLINKWDITYEEFDKNRKELLNIISKEEFEKILL